MKKIYEIEPFSNEEIVNMMTEKPFFVEHRAGNILLIVGYDHWTGKFIISSSKQLSALELSERYKFLNGNPFGKIKEIKDLGIKQAIENYESKETK